MIHPTAIVSEKALLGSNIEIGPFTIIHSNVQIGDNCKIGSNCELGIPSSLSDGSPLIISKNSIIRSHSIFYESSKFGEGLVTGHHVTVREKTVAGEGLQIGTLGDIQGHCSIGKFVKFHSNVHIGQSSIIGDFVWIFPYTVLTNDPHPPSNLLQGVTVEDYAVIATMSVILPGVKIGKGTLVGAHSLVNRDTPADMLVAGSPAKNICETSVIKRKDNKKAAYPWRKHFHRGYPEEIVNKWIEEFKND